MSYNVEHLHHIMEGLEGGYDSENLARDHYITPCPQSQNVSSNQQLKEPKHKIYLSLCFPDDKKRL